ncbi:hypothetical protein LXL04_018457 [Taraxacum kok-saghyz]
MVVQIGVMMCEIEGTVFEIVTLLEIVGRVFDTVVVDTVIVDTVVVDIDTDTVVVFASKLEMPAAIDIAQDRKLGGIPLAAEGCLPLMASDHNYEFYKAFYMFPLSSLSSNVYIRIAVMRWKPSTNSFAEVLRLQGVIRQTPRQTTSPSLAVPRQTTPPDSPSSSPSRPRRLPSELAKGLQRIDVAFQRLYALNLQSILP